MCKKREDSKALICMVSNQAMLERHIKEVPDVAYDIMDLATKPTTIVFERRPVPWAVSTTSNRQLIVAPESVQNDAQKRLC